MSEMISRRSFLKVAGVSVVGAAAFGLTGCGGGGGGSSSTDTVYGVITVNRLTDWVPGSERFFTADDAQKEHWPKLCRSVMAFGSRWMMYLV